MVNYTKLLQAAPAFRPIGNKVNYPNPCSARAYFKVKTENLVSVRIN